MDVLEEDRIVAALRAASSQVLRGVTPRWEVCRAAAAHLGWARVSAARWKALDHGYRLALHRKVWLRKAEGACGPYVHGDPRPIARYPADDLHSLAQEALRRRPPAANDAEGAVILARFLGFTTVPSEDMAVLIAAVSRAGLIPQ